MTIRGGGNPILDMACAPRFRMGPPPRSFAADAYDCIMARLATEPTEYKFVARCSRLHGELPSDCLALSAACHRLGGKNPTWTANQIDCLSRPGNVTVTIDNWRSTYPDI